MIPVTLHDGRREWLHPDTIDALGIDPTRPLGPREWDLAAFEDYQRERKARR